jgi:predicted metal-binding protein
LVYKNEIAELKLGYEAILLSIEELSDETIRDRCRISKCYGKRYSCPPSAPFISHFHKGFKNIFTYLIFMQGRDIKNWFFLSDLIYSFGRRIEECLEGISFIAGECRLCETCELELGKPCSKPKEMRYSFTGVGLDAGKLSEILNYKLWDETRTSAVGGCLTNKETADHEMLFQIFCEVANKDEHLSHYLCPRG